MKALPISITLIILLLVSININAQLELIHYWHFNNTQPADGSGNISYGPHPIFSDYSTLSNKSYVIYSPINNASSDTGSVDNCSGKSKNDRPGFGGCCGTIDNGLRTRNPSDNMQFLWYIPTTNYENIVITYATETSSLKSGQYQQVFSYSTDNGKTFVKTDLPILNYIPDTTWKKVVMDLKSNKAFNNNDQLIFRITYYGQNTGSKGNNRYDNITVEGTRSTTTINNTDVRMMNIYPNPVNDMLQISTNTETDKSIALYSPQGTLISKFTFSGKQYTVNTSKLSPGLYYLDIADAINSTNQKIKFVKQ